jgi:hypothetical protein
MARLKDKSVFSGISGSIGKEIVFKQYADKTVVSKYPDMSKIKPSKRQKVQRNKLKEANAYAQKVNRDPVLRAAYESGLQPGESVYHKAKKHFFELQKANQ